MYISIMATGRVSTIFICLVAVVLCNDIQVGLLQSLLGIEPKPTPISLFNRLNRSRGRSPLTDKSLADERRKVLKEFHYALAASNGKLSAGTAAPAPSLRRRFPWSLRSTVGPNGNRPRPQVTGSQKLTKKYLPFKYAYGTKDYGKPLGYRGDYKEESSGDFDLADLLPSWFNPFSW